MPYRAMRRYRRSTVVRPYQSRPCGPPRIAQIVRAPGIAQTAHTAHVPCIACIALTACVPYIVRTGNGVRCYNQGSIQWSTIRKANSAIR